MAFDDHDHHYSLDDASRNHLVHELETRLPPDYALSEADGKNGFWKVVSDLFGGADPKGEAKFLFTVYSSPKTCARGTLE